MPVGWPVEQLYQHPIRLHHVCRLQLDAGHSFWCCHRSGHKSLLTAVVGEPNFPLCASHRATLTLIPVSAWVEMYASLCKWVGHAAYRSIFLFQSSEQNDWLKRKGNKRTSFSSCVCTRCYTRLFIVCLFHRRELFDRQWRAVQITQKTNWLFVPRSG